MVDLKEFDPILIQPDKIWREGKVLLTENSNAIHVFQAFRGIKGYNYFPLIIFALRRGIKVVVFDEPYSISPVGYLNDEQPIIAHFKTWIWPILHRSIAKLLNIVTRPNSLCLMPISIIAKRQMIKDGFTPDIIFPFGYFVPRHQITDRNDNEHRNLRLIFVGALIYRKGLDILLDAVRELFDKGYKISLDIYGSGVYKNINHSNNLPVTYKGTLPIDQIQSVIAEHDVLILPSRHDGWGVVVNEALLQGIPVILSNRVGAKCFVESSGAGSVFETENVDDLARKIKMLIDNPKLLQEMKKNAHNVGNEILPEMGARYFLNSISFYYFNIGIRPFAIWSIDKSDQRFVVDS